MMEEQDSMASTQAPPDLLAEIGELRRESDELARSTTESVAEHVAGTRADAEAEACMRRLADGGAETPGIVAGESAVAAWREREQ